MQGHVQKHGTDDPTLWGSFLGWSEMTLFDHPCLQPALDQFPGGERAELGEKVGMVDSVECRRQVSVECPTPAGGLAVRDGEDALR